MAKMTIKGLDEWGEALAKMGADSTRICKNAVAKGAGIVADEIRKHLEALPEDKFRRLKDGEKFVGVPKEQKKDLLDSLGITPIDTDHRGNINAKVGFDGYGSFKTTKYPKGVPNPLLARAIESGSSVRQKTPFVRPAVNKVKKRVIEEMGKSVENDLKNYSL